MEIRRRWDPTVRICRGVKIVGRTLTLIVSLINGLGIALFVERLMGFLLTPLPNTLTLNLALKCLPLLLILNCLVSSSFTFKYEFYHYQ